VLLKIEKAALKRTLFCRWDSDLNFVMIEWLLMLDGSGFWILSGRRAIAVPNFGRKDC
jgi:hypothetical protein